MINEGIDLKQDMQKNDIVTSFFNQTQYTQGIEMSIGMLMIVNEKEKNTDMISWIDDKQKQEMRLKWNKIFFSSSSPSFFHHCINRTTSIN